MSESEASASKREASASEREASASEPGRARVIRRQRVKSFFFFEFSICFIYNLSLSFFLFSCWPSNFGVLVFLFVS